MLIFLNGANEYQAKQAIKQLVAKYIAKNPSGHELIKISPLDSDFSANWRNVLSDFKAVPLFSTSRLVILERVGELSVALQSELAKNLTNIPDSTVIVIWDSKEIKDKDLLVQLKGAKVISASPLSETQLISWIKASAKSREITLSSEDLQGLLSESGGDMWYIQTELDKIVNNQNSERSFLHKKVQHPFAVFNFVRSKKWQDAGKLIVSEIKIGKPFEMVMGGLAAAIRKEISNNNERLKLNELLINIDMGLKTGQLDEREAAILLAGHLSKQGQKTVRWEDQWEGM